MLERNLSQIKIKNKIDLVVAQAENVSGRKGLIERDYLRLKRAGVDIFTLGNHYLARSEIKKIIRNNDIVSPANLPSYHGSCGSRVFKIKGLSLRVTSLLGITFNRLRLPWEQTEADNFFDKIDELINISEKNGEDFHIVDFHAETTSEKCVLAMYLDGKVDAIVGTHTHVQTNDARFLAAGTFFITDLGMVGPRDSAIGVDYYDVYKMLRYKERVSFKVSNALSQFNGVILVLSKDDKREFKVLNFLDEL